LIDTVSFLTPKIPQLFIDKIKLKLKLYNCIDCDTGELIYQFSTGSIAGSFDSSINIKINVDNTIKITCSIHKVILGYNIAYGSDNLILLANCLKKILYKAFEVKLPDVMTWELMQIDYTLTFNLGSQENVESYVNSLKNVSYCRREAKHYNNNGLQLSGATTVVKFYNKQKEFIAHDYKKIKDFAGHEKADELIDLAQGLLRVEISIRSRKIKQIFTKTIYRKQMQKLYRKAINQYGLKSATVQNLEHILSKNKVTLKDFNIEKIIKIWESEVLKVLKDKNDIVLVNKDNLVLEKLRENFSTRKVSAIYTFWTLLSTRGEEYVKTLYKSSTFYRLRKELINSGISWKDTNIYIETNHKVIAFNPCLDSEFLYDLNKPNYEFKEKVYNLLKVI